MASPRFYSKQAQKEFKKSKKNAMKAFSLKTFKVAKATELQTTHLPEKQASEALKEIDPHVSNHG